MVAVADSCSGFFARLGRGVLHSPLWAGRKILNIARHGRDVWVEDYVGAIKKGETWPESFYLFAKRAIIAPRSREKDPILRQTELKKFQLLPAVMDPLLDGTIETVSKVKVWTGGKPLEKTISIPAGMAAGVVTYGYYASTYDFFRTKIDVKDIDAHKGELGLEYLESWRRRQLLSSQEAIKIYNRHNQILAKWVQGRGKGGGDRILPPRIVQFVKEGLLAPEEVEAFEQLALKAHQTGLAKGEGTEDTKVKAALRDLLTSDPLWTKRSKAERELLARVFDPPVFFGAEEGIGWLEKLRDRKPAVYDEALRQKTDLFWMKAVAQGDDPSFRAIRALPAGDPIDLATLAFIGSTEAGKKEIAARKSWAEAGGFPAEKMHIVSRVEYPLYSASPLPIVHADGKETKLEKEDDYWKLLVKDPAFSDLKSKWVASPDQAELEMMGELRERALQVSQLNLLQKDRREGGKLLDPTPAHFCFLMEDNPHFSKPVDAEMEKLAAKDEDSQLFCRYHFAIQRWRKIGEGAGNWNQPFQGEAGYCQGDALEKFAAQVGVAPAQVREALKCEK